MAVARRAHVHPTHPWPAATAANADRVREGAPCRRPRARRRRRRCAHTSGGSGRAQNELEGARNEEAGAERDRTTEEATEEVNEEEEEGGPRAPGVVARGVGSRGKEPRDQDHRRQAREDDEQRQVLQGRCGWRGEEDGSARGRIMRERLGGTREGTRADAGGGELARAPGMPEDQHGAAAAAAAVTRAALLLRGVPERMTARAGRVGGGDPETAVTRSGASSRRRGGRNCSSRSGVPIVAVTTAIRW